MYINAVTKTQDEMDERDAYLNDIPAIAALDKQTEHYRITRSFLEAPERMLRILFED